MENQTKQFHVDIVAAGSLCVKKKEERRKKKEEGEIAESRTANENKTKKQGRNYQQQKRHLERKHGSAGARRMVGVKWEEGEGGGGREEEAGGGEKRKKSGSGRQEKKETHQHQKNCRSKCKPVRCSYRNHCYSTDETNNRR